MSKNSRNRIRLDSSGAMPDNLALQVDQPTEPEPPAEPATPVSNPSEPDSPKEPLLQPAEGMSPARRDLILTAIFLLLTAAVVAYNAITSPPLSAPMVYYATSAGLQGDLPEKPDNTGTETANSAVTEVAEAGSTDHSANSRVPSAVSSAGPVTASSSAVVSGRININTAALEQLDSLPGIGPALAQRIIDHREQNGPFVTMESIKEVNGIGDKKLEAMRDHSCLSD